jgi:hypothetical protein
MGSLFLLSGLVRDKDRIAVTPEALRRWGG